MGFLFKCLLIRDADLQRFNADSDLDPIFAFDADTDPAPRKSDANLRPLVYITSRAPYCASSLHWERPRSSTAPFKPLKLLDFNGDPDSSLSI